MGAVAGVREFDLRRAALSPALAALYVALEWLSSFHEYKGLPFTAWDPGLGALFAALILKPAAAVPALFFGIIASEALALPAVALPRSLAVAIIEIGRAHV